jgi:septum formation protein
MMTNPVTSMTDLILASQSPRRRTMLGWLDLAFDTTAAHIDESPIDHETPLALAARLARRKAEAARTTGAFSEPLLAADTVVDLEGRSLGKPATAEAARAMLRALRTTPHTVHTCLALADPDDDGVRCRCVTTEVRMRAYTDREIDRYVATSDPLDKAGGYAIQHAGFHPVKTVDRCYATVVGLPFCGLAELLRPRWTFDLASMPALCLANLGYPCPKPDPGTAR